jgi:hypothetical protein
MTNVIKKIKTKNNDSFSSTMYLGAEQRFVGALRGNTGVDNLEEQYIIGVDCITWEKWSGTDHKHTITKEFRNGEQSTDYYKLVCEYNKEEEFEIFKTETLYYIDKYQKENLISVKTIIQTQTVDSNGDKEIKTIEIITK